jgi:MFS family permease
VGPADDQRAALERNLRLIPVHIALSRSLVWISVMVLFTRARFDLDGALQLSSIYYLSVVVLEVPSGWMSDRLGRVTTVRVAAASWIVSHSLFLIGDDTFWVVALAQFFLAGGFASLSGTDVTLHYDTLESLGIADEFARREARVSSLAYIATAISALAGGALGLVDLRLAFAASLVLACAQLAVTLRLGEPPGEHQADHQADPLVRQLALCMRYLRQRFIGWIFFYGILLVTLEHVAFSLMQPWLTEVLDRTPDDVGSTPLFAGVVFAATALVGSFAARSSAPLADRFGIVATLIGLGVVSAAIVTGMWWTTSAAMLLVVVFRSVQGAAAPVLISAAVAPLTLRQHRATLLSLNSLAGRLGWGGILLVVSTDAGDDVTSTLGTFAWLSWAMIAVLLATSWVATSGRPASDTGHLHRR